MPTLRRVRSLCPVCLRPVEAAYAADLLGNVRLVKKCPEHGEFQALVWPSIPGLPSFSAWKNKPSPPRPFSPAPPRERGCPLDCGLCPEHSGQTCCALLEVTSRCDMGCPVCYASATAEGKGADPDLGTLADMLKTLKQQGGLANVQLSGGEPTVRDDLPEIIGLIRAKGFPFVQLNTNGLRLAREEGYAARLKAAGLDVVYLQMDGLRQSTFQALRGRDWRAEKMAAAQRCVEAGLPLVLVATVARGVNDDELGDLLRTALALGPCSRGLHLQPMAAFGRNPWKAGEAPRLTLPELMAALEKQTGGQLRARDFHPPASEHALCSFSALYSRTDEGCLELVQAAPSCCGADQRPVAHRARDFVARHWGGTGGLERRFTVSAMAFQDVYALDLDRLRRCHIHIVTQSGGLAPFCAYNLTSADGSAIYRGA